MQMAVKKILPISLLFVSAAFSTQKANAQLTTNKLLGQLNTITTAVPFLMISPDARAGGMGDQGVATSPDANSMHWNPSKLVFLDPKSGKTGFSVNYTPWLRQLVPDINLSYLSFYYLKDSRQAFGASLRYFSLGDITFTDNFGTNIGTFNPNEFSVDGTYSRKLGEHFSTGVSLRYIYSNLTGGLDQYGQSKAGNAAAGDISFYYKKPGTIKEYKVQKMFGLNISNLGSKISYSASGARNFLPCNMRLGGGYDIQFDEYNRLIASVELSKLLVPTNPVYKKDANGALIIDPTTQRPVIERGEDPYTKGTIEGVFSSFNDAPGFLDAQGNLVPGSVLKEELREINQSIGLEYWYANQFALRGGFFNEHPTKGGRQYFTFGAGLKYNVFKIDFAYLVPTNRQLGRSPLQNTLRFSLSFDMSAFQTPKDELKVN
jgi:hypothetical protein